MTNKENFSNKKVNVFDDYFESFNTKDLTVKGISKFINDINENKFNGIFRTEETSVDGQTWTMSNGESVHKREWNISYTNEKTNQKPIDFKFEFDEDIGILYWKKGKTIAEHFVSNQFCDKVVHHFGGSVLLNDENGVVEDDIHFSQEFSTIEKYLDFILLSGTKYGESPKQFASSIKRNVKESLGEGLYLSLNNEYDFNLPSKKCI